MVRLARWTLVLLAATCAAAAADQQAQEQTCIAPSVVMGFEQKITALELSNADVSTRLDLATSEWKAERKALVATYDKEKADHKSTATLLRNTKAKSEETIALLEKKLEKAESSHREQLQNLDAQMESLKNNLAAQKELALARESETMGESARLDAAAKEWEAEKKALNAKFDKEQTEHRSTFKLLRNTKARSDETVALLEKKLEKVESNHREQLESFDVQVQSLKSELAAQKASALTRDSESSAARDRLAQYVAKVKVLEKDVQQSRKSNEALRSALESKETEISLSALLSSYYDEGVVVAANTVAVLREQAEQSSGTLTKVVNTLESTKKTVVDTTDKFYSENLAATVDPILADIRVAADPHVKKYLPIVQVEAEKAKTEAIKLSQEGLKRAKSARLEAIALLEQNENVRSHAQKIVDGVLIAVAVPLALLQFRFLLRVVWWLFTTAICVLTLGCCCSRKRKSSSRKSSSRKTLASPVAIAGTSAATTGSAQKKKAAAGSSTTQPASATKRTIGGKKNVR